MEVLHAIADASGDPIARQEAIRLLGRVGDAGVRPVLERIAENADEDGRVTEAVELALNMLGE